MEQLYFLKIIVMKKYFFAFLLIFFCFYSKIQAQIITTIAGCDTFGYSGDGEPATAAKLSGISAVAVDVHGNVYISDAQYNNVVRKINTSGIISTIAGNDTAGYGGDNGPATAAKLSNPDCISIDKKGNIYISDIGNRRVRKVNALGIITTFAGNGNNYTIDGVPATATGIGGGGGVGNCIDVAGNIYISAGTRILKVDTFGILSTFAGNGVGGYTGDGGPATAAGIGSADQIAMDEFGNMYIANGYSVIRKINTAGIISTVAGNGTVGFSGDGGPATTAQLNDASGIFPDNCGNFYISDLYNNRIRKVDGHGIITTIAGNGYGAGHYGSTWTGGYSGDGGPATAAEFYGPVTIYLDKNSSIYIADGYNYCVRKITMDSCKSVMEVASPGLPKGEEMLSVFPNPASDNLTISNPAIIGVDSYHIRNMLGQEVANGSVVAGNNNVDIHGLAPGSYIITLQKAMRKPVITSL